MKKVVTDISARYLPMITIFFEANGLFALGFTLGHTDVPMTVNITQTPPSGVQDQKSMSFEMTKSVVSYEYDDEDEEQSTKIMFMAVKHLGVNNMLHDFLNKCGYPNHTS